MLILTKADVESLLDADLLRAAMATALADLSAGKVSMPTRIAAMVAERDGLLAAMPAYLPSGGALTTKLVSLFPRNTDRPTHQAVIVAFDAATGTPAALLDGEAITAARTAACSALATDLLARKDAKRLVVIGTGVQARAHLRAVARAVKPDLILLDLHIPKLDGWGFVKKFREGDDWAKTVPVIAVSASATPPERERALRTGCDDFLPKPYYPEQMRDMLHKHLAARAKRGTAR